MTTTDATIQWLRGLPKAELHLHLEGTVTPESLVTLSERHDPVPLTLQVARDMYRYSDFVHFLDVFGLVCDRLLTPEDYGFVTARMIRDLAVQGVRHAEVYVAWGNIMRLKPDLWPRIEHVMECMERARREGEEEFGVSVLWIVDASRDRGPEHAKVVFEKAADLKSRFASIVGVGIGGDEARGPCHWFKDVYAAAKKTGLRLTAHAGESTGQSRGPKEIQAALDMGTERIGHAVAAQWDEEVMETLIERQVPLEINITSNICTGVCKTLEEHPLKMYHDRGLLVTLNSDDPAMFGSNLLEEYTLVHKRIGLSLKQLKDLAAASFRASFLSSEKKDEFLKAVKQYQLP